MEKIGKRDPYVLHLTVGGNPSELKICRRMTFFSGSLTILIWTTAQCIW